MSVKRLVYKPTNSYYQVLSSEAFTKHGLNVHGVIFDELHSQPNRELFDVMTKGSVRVIASNKKARHDYFIEDTYEAGIVLHGTEVKSLRQGHCSIKESFVRIDNGEVIIYGMHINPYEKGNIFNKDPLRPKKLMLHKYEINKLVGKLNEKGLTLVPLQVYFKGSL